MNKSEIKSKIRQGKFPRFMFCKGKNMKLERKPHPKFKHKTKLTWRMQSTVKVLADD